MITVTSNLYDIFIPLSSSFTSYSLWLQFTKMLLSKCVYNWSFLPCVPFNIGACFEQTQGGSSPAQSRRTAAGAQVGLSWGLQQWPLVGCMLMKYKLTAFISVDYLVIQSIRQASNARTGKLLVLTICTLWINIDFLFSHHCELKPIFSVLWCLATNILCPLVPNSLDSLGSHHLLRPNYCHCC